MKRQRKKPQLLQVISSAKVEPTTDLTYNLSSLDPNSLFDYVRSELRRGYELQNDEQRYKERRDKLYLTLHIPLHLEKVSDC